MSAPTISVVMALRDKAPYVADAIRSILAQTRPAEEIIIVDDGSRDGSDRIAEKFLDRGVILQRSEGVGAGPARNLAMARAKGSLIAFLDGDDLWLPDHLQMLETASRAFPSATMIATDFVRFEGVPPSLEPQPPAAPRPADYFVEDRYRVRFCTITTAVCRKAALAVGGFAALRAGEDRWLWQAMALRGPSAVIDRVTALYRRGIPGIMQDFGEREAAVREVSPPMRQMEEYLAAHPDCERRPVIDAYLAARWRAGIRQSLAAARPAMARWNIAQMTSRGYAPGTAYQIMSYLPAPILRLAMGANRLRRRWSA